jgi:hypothetical protein
MSKLEEKAKPLREINFVYNWNKEYVLLSDAQDEINKLEKQVEELKKWAKGCTCFNDKLDKPIKL